MDPTVLSSPLAPDPEIVSTSFHDQYASELGRMTGGMLSEGSEEEINGSSVLVLLQAIAHECESKELVLGAQPAIDGKSTFVAMSSGRIARISQAVKDRNLTTSFEYAAQDEVISECEGIGEYGDLARNIVATKLAAAERVQPDDAVSGRTETDPHAAIVGRCNVRGHLVVTVGSTDAIRCAVHFLLDCPPNVDLASMGDYVRVKEMTKEEIQQSREETNSKLGVSSPFPVKAGVA